MEEIVKKRTNYFYSLFFALLLLTSFVFVGGVNFLTTQSYAESIKFTYSDDSSSKNYLISVVGGDPIVVSEYNVTFNSRGGTCSPSSIETTDASITLPTPTRTGYTFICWSVTISDATELYQAGETYTFQSNDGGIYNITMNAMWEINEYTISFEDDYVNVDALTQNYGSTVTLPNPTRDGYTFNGWYLDEELTQVADISAMGSEDITLYAGWTQNTYNNATLLIILGIGVLVLIGAVPVVLLAIKKSKEKTAKK
ncbi:MAG: hypothetical protein EOM55_04010 [Clostridia bacterium]|nr:hypothetical protein [Clostridia bacterium]